MGQCCYDAGEKQCTQKKICFSATFSTINPIWTGLGSNPGLHIERLEYNCLIHDTSLSTSILLWSQSVNEGEEDSSTNMNG